MALQLYAHPFSSYCQKVLIALYENATPFEYRLIRHDDPAMQAELAALWPFRRFPVLVDNGTVIRESSIIIEYLALNYPGPIRLLPDDKRAALDVRFMDRIFDNDVQTPLQKIVSDCFRSDTTHDTQGIIEARQKLDTAYRWLNGTLQAREWAAGESFSLADCAAAPALFYADWVHPIAEEFSHVRDYRQRLLARPSYARAVDEARPYRPLFPLGSPDRD